MYGWQVWFVSGLFAASACGGRSSLEFPIAGESGVPVPHAGGQPSGGSAGVTSGGSGASAAGNGGMGTAGAPTTPGLVTAISAGTGMTCALLSNGNVWCWGGNDAGQLGDGTTTSSAVPVRVKGIDTAVAISAGGTWNTGGQNSAALSAFACAVLHDGTVRCWGHDPLGVMLGSAGFDSAVPVAVPGVNDALAIASGDWHACALTNSGSVLCWGDRRWASAVLGDATTTACAGSGCPPGTSPFAPVLVPGLESATAIAGTGSKFSCAVLNNGSVQCWGACASASAGCVDTTSPVQVSDVITSRSGIAVGFNHACAVTFDGQVRCWGDNAAGALGDGTIGDAPGLRTVSGLHSTAIAVSAGLEHTCAVLSDGTIQCWGANYAGELGDGTQKGSAVPVSVAGLNDAVAVSAGYTQTCALTSAGAVFCWGSSVHGPDSIPKPITGFF